MKTPESLPLPPVSIEERARDPHRYFAERRAEGPIQWMPSADGRDQVAVVVDGSAVLAGLTDADLSAAEAVSFGRSRPVVPTQSDPPAHTRYRAFLDPLFRRSEMARLEPVIMAHTDALIDRFIEQGYCEFRTDFAVPLPGLAFLALMGLPDSDLDFLLTFKDNILKPTGSVAERRAAQAHWAEQGDAYFADAIRHKRRYGGDDLLTRLMEADLNGDRLDDEELQDFAFQIVLGGTDTVAATLCLMWINLAGNQEHRRLARSEPASIRLLVEELMRWETPVTVCKRVARRGLDIGGFRIEAGQFVNLNIMSANSDPRVITEPDVLDVRRRGNSHHAFGGGIHRCLGSHLARIELAATIAQWHRRIPDYAIAPGADLHYSDANSLRMVDALPLVWPTR
jgi:cytochrome P450